MRLMITFIISFIVSVSALANQTFEVEDGGRYNITLSVKDLNRLVIQGGKISKFRGEKGYLEVKKGNGDAYLSPLISFKNYAFFITDNNGNTYTLVSTIKDIPSQTITLVPPKGVNDLATMAAKKRFGALALKQKVAMLGKAMWNDESLSGFEITKHDKPLFVKRWKEVKFGLVRTYDSDEIMGEVFRLENVSRKQMLLKEGEFFDVGHGILAVSIKKHDLTEKSSTLVYFVRRKGEKSNG